MHGGLSYGSGLSKEGCFRCIRCAGAWTNDTTVASRPLQNGDGWEGSSRNPRRGRALIRGRKVRITVGEHRLAHRHDTRPPEGDRQHAEHGISGVNTIFEGLQGQAAEV